LQFSLRPDSVMRPDSVPDLGAIQIIYLLTYLLTYLFALLQFTVCRTGLKHFTGRWVSALISSLFIVSQYRR